MSAPVENGTTPAAATDAAVPAVETTTAAKSQSQQPIDNQDVNHWKNRVNELVTQKGQTEAAVADAKPWHNGLFSCFTPVDTCMS